MSARTSGTTAAANAPKAISRIRNVAGMVMISELSRSLLTTSLMSSLIIELLKALIS